MTLTIQDKIKALAKKNYRSLQLIADFSDGYAGGWEMAVKECFRTQLDIRYTVRVENHSVASGLAVKRQVKVWTQGPRISFDVGHVFYDTPLAYGRWDQALRHMKRACVVTEASPNDIRKKKTGSINELIDGHVLIKLFVPNQSKTGLIPQSRFKFSQNNFIGFLITGKLDQAEKLNHHVEHEDGN